MGQRQRSPSASVDQDVSASETDDGATSFLCTPTNTSILTYLISAHGIPAGSTIKSVTIQVKVLKLDPADALTREAVRIGSTNYTNGTAFSPTAQNVNELSTGWVMTTNPATGVAWTLSDLTSLETWIYKENTAGERCTYIPMTIDYTAAATGPVDIPAMTQTFVGTGVFF